MGHRQHCCFKGTEARMLFLGEHVANKLSSKGTDLFQNFMLGPDFAGNRPSLFGTTG